MDTKLTEIKENKVNLKESKLFYRVNIVFLLIILAVSIGMIACCSKIKTDVNKYYITSYRKNTLTNKVLCITNPVLFKDALEIKEGNSIEGSNIFIKQSEEIPEEAKSSLKDSVDDFLENGKEKIDEIYKSLDYDVLDADGNVIKSNTESELSKLVQADNTKALYNKYLFYITIKYDENGQIDIENVYGAAKNKAIDDLKQELIKSKITGRDENKKYLVENPIKNVTFVYGIKKSDQDWDSTSREMKEDLKEVYGDMSNNNSVFILTLVIAALTLIIPLKFEKEVFLVKKILKLPVELLLIMLAIIISFFWRYSQEVMKYSITGEYEGYLSALNGSIGSFSIIVYIVYWILFASGIFISIIVIKNMLSIGTDKYFKENIWLINRKIDFSKKSIKLPLIIVSINFVAVLLIIIIWDLLIKNGIYWSMAITLLSGLGVMFVYSLIIFYIINKSYNKVSDKFATLLDETNRIAEGNINAFILDEDLGLFNPLKEAILKIKDGFKKAVEEEVKSQKMKTELISNVSHDLKTPLTSIITYVDLLKAENLTEEERKNYLDTLDKKSQRLKYLIEDLFEVSKATSGNIKLNIVKVDVVELMKQTEIELEDKINKASLDVKNNFPREKVILNLDSQKTYRIFENLLINVVKYAMKGSRVYVDILNNENYVEVIIKNMSAEEINFNSEDIVERFQRGDKSRNTEGSGLGLAIVKSFVEVQDGKFDVDVDGDLFKIIIQFKKL